MLLSLVPAVLADGAEPIATALEIGTPTPKNETDVDGKSVSYYEIPVSIKNNTDQTVQLTMLECYIKFDASSFKAVSYYKNEDTEVSGITYKRPVNNQTWKNEYSIINGLVTVACGMGPGLSLNDKRITVAAHGSALVFTLNLQKMDDNVESGNYAFTFAEPFEVDGLWKENMIGFKGEVEKDKTDTFYYKQRESNLDCTDTEILPITDGKAPELYSVSVARKTIEYGSTDTLKLTATSTSGKDITSLVTFGVKNESSTDVTSNFTIAADGTLSIGSNDAGTYTVTATPKAGACLGEEKTATFKITPATITNPTVTISNFGKGQTIPATATMSDGLTFGTIEWKDESGTKVESGKFAGSSTYTAVITFSADGNHQLAENSTVSVSGVDSQYVTGNQLTGPDAEGKYTVTLTLKTADKEVPAVTVKSALSATYGQTLSDIADQLNTALTASVEGSFTWVKDGATPVGPVNGNNQFEVRFTPTDSANYATATATVTVNVAKKQITFNKADYAWRAMNGETTETQLGKGIVFTYDGKEHGIEPYCTNNSIKDFVQFEYDPAYNRHTSVNTIGATVRANVVAADENCEIVGDVKQLSGDWTILSKTISFDGEYTANVQACYSVTSHTVTLGKFGLPNEVTSDPNTRYTLRDNKVIVDNNVLDVNSVVYENGTLRFNLVSGLSDTAVGTEASIMFGLHVNNYKTNHAAVSGISNGTEANLFILKADITLIAKSTDAETMTVEVPNAEYGVGVTPKVTGKPDSVGALDFVYTNTETKQTYTQDTIMTAPAGEYTLTVTCEDNTTIYKATATFTITQRSITDATVTFTDLTYNGSEQTTEITVKIGEKTLTMGTDYTIGSGVQTKSWTDYAAKPR